MMYLQKIKNSVSIKSLLALLILVYIVYDIYSYSNTTGASINGVLEIDVSDKNPLAFMYNNGLLIRFLLLYCIISSDYIHNILEFRYTYELVRNRNRKKYFMGILKRIIYLGGLSAIFYVVLLMATLGIENVDKINMALSILNYIVFLIILAIFIDMVYLVLDDRNVSVVASIISYMVFIYISVFIYYFNLMYEGYFDGVISLAIRFVMLLILIFIFRRTYLKKDFM